MHKGIGSFEIKHETDISENIPNEAGRHFKCVGTNPLLSTWVILLKKVKKE
ncbi:MAG TPA: hypothetical protein VKA87_05050 [Nitrososphaeraceae archaeon]|nr:hypothetical protein [Nitrososphaeraceae archaeon]